MTTAEFYSKWSDKPADLIAYDIAAGLRKGEVLARTLSAMGNNEIKTIVDLGCGFGSVLKAVAASAAIQRAWGFDCSETAVKIASNEFGTDTITFHKLNSMDVVEAVAQINKTTGGKVDIVLLADFLEHVPSPGLIIKTLAPLTRFFLIKLPVEFSLLDNYILPKEYPSPTHSNGHLREFSVNSVYGFIRNLGLTPVCEQLYKYDINDTFPPQKNLSLKRFVLYNCLKLFKWGCSVILPKKLFMAVVGGGGYYCLATFSEKNVLASN